MKSFKFSISSLLSIAVLLVVGIGSTISSGGGSGGPAPPPPSGDTDPTLAINAANGEDVSSAVVTTIIASFDLGEISGNGPFAQAAGPGLAGMKALGPLYSKFGSPLEAVQENCAIDGTVDLTINIADLNAPTVGDRIVAVFANCDDNLGYVISGTVDLTIAALQGDVNTDVFLIAFDTILTDVEIIEGVDVYTADGGFTLTLDALEFPVLTTSMVGEDLQLGSNGEVVSLSDFDHSLTVDTGVVPDTKLAEASGRLDSNSLGGSVDYVTTTPLQGTGDQDPHSGVILITGAGNSSVRIVVVDSQHVTLEIDSNGDGVVDDYIDTTWAALEQQAGGGQVSSINSSNARTIAREVFNGITGFGSVAVTAGGQFGVNGAFDLVRQQSLSGNFGPLTFDCATSGTVDISGSIATAGTYTSNDHFEAFFTNCVRGNDELDRAMTVDVDSFDAGPGDAYLVSATVTENDLLRFFGGSCFSGTGTFETSYDFLYTTANSIQMTSSANAINIWAGGRSQDLAAAIVTAQIDVGQQPAIITRQSSGVITSDDLVGIFTYESTVPDIFVVDDLATTGPYNGRLLVTAADGSTMTLVGQDQLNARLELDFDGDTAVDEQIVTTWADLGYGNSFGLCDQ